VAMMSVLGRSTTRRVCKHVAEVNTLVARVSHCVTICKLNLLYTATKVKSAPGVIAGYQGCSSIKDSTLPAGSDPDTARERTALKDW
jgi:hypothetical protein